MEGPAKNPSAVRPKRKLAVRIGIAVMLVALLGYDAALADPPDTIYSVVRIGSALGDDDKVGSRRAGLMCLPQGVLRWSDLASAGSMDQREAVQDVLEDAGLAVTPLGEASETGVRGRRHLRVRGTVIAAAFSLCAKHWGLGNGKALSGDTGLDIEWRAESLASDDLPRKHVSRVTRRIGGDHAASVTAIYRVLLKDAALDLARWLRAGAVSDAGADQRQP